MSISDIDGPVGQLDQLLLSVSILLLEPGFGQVRQETTLLRDQLAELLTQLRTYDEGLHEARAANEFGTDPTLSGHILKLQGRINRIRTTVDLELVPRLRILNKSVALGARSLRAPSWLSLSMRL